MLDKLYITPRQWLHILRWCLYAVLFLLLMMVQTVVLGNRTVLGVHLQFVPIVIACVCLREGPERGGLFALLASVFWCLSGADSGAVSIVMLTVVPVLGSVFCRALVANKLLSCLMVALVTLFLEQSLIFLLKYFSGNMEGILYLTELLPCVLISMLSFFPIYFLVKSIEKIGDAYEST